MLAGCSSALLSPRHQLRSDASVQLQGSHFQLQEKHHTSQQRMGTQRFDLPCSFSRKDATRVAISLEKPAETRSSSCTFRPNPVTASSSSVVARAVSWEGRIEITEGGPWERRRSSKRSHERSSSEEEDSCLDRAKRTRTGDTTGLVVGEDDIWLPQCTKKHPLVEEEEEEEKVLLVPNAALFPFFTSASSTLVGSFETGRGSGTGVQPNNKSQSDSSSSSDTRSSSPKQHRDSSDNVARNGPQIPYPSGFASMVGQGENTQTEQQGLELVSLLTSCAESISSGNHEAIAFYLARLGELASPRGSPIHRVVAYFTEALALCAVKLWPHIFSITPPRVLVDQSGDNDDATALQLLNQVSPIPKFLHFTLNERLLRAFEGKDRVHIIDFDIKQGLQWPSLFQSLACRANPPSHVRITGIGESRQDLHDTGARLARFAEAFNLPFEFHAVVDRLEDVRLWMLHVKREDCVAVNCVLMMHKTLYDENGGALMDLLGLIRSTNPAIVLMAEQEAQHNEPRWETRLANSLQYYSAIFDSLDCSLPEDSLARIKIEEMFAREIRNLVACEGSERVDRHEKFERWRKLMEDGGFRCMGIGEREMLQSRLILRMYNGENYSIDKQGEESDGLTLKWLNQSLYTVSAWAPNDVAGSSATSQPS
ncbi:protein DWARF AND LOW-TILLERING [Elaeis guineensis]|uniref:Protein DWARF AND LOW-TILLERING n=1 Tax=Elaeis guineensis var. tenera TaxID=51953 RepID=A0A8N4IBZ7_ELAGV|nr:protein DWARF AND LOW-TILLERING [Elaeis guineensis]